MLAFGSDSLVELLSPPSGSCSGFQACLSQNGGASRTAGALLFVLAFVVATSAVGQWLLGCVAETSFAGIGITIAALIAMPALAFF